MCFYVNLLELWSFSILLSRGDTKPNNDNDNNKAKVGKQSHWNSISSNSNNKDEKAPIWPPMTIFAKQDDDSKNKNNNNRSAKQKLIKQNDGNIFSLLSDRHQNNPTKHYGSNLVGSFISVNSAGARDVDVGVGLNDLRKATESGLRGGVGVGCVGEGLVTFTNRNSIMSSSEGRQQQLSDTNNNSNNNRNQQDGNKEELVLNNNTEQQQQSLVEASRFRIRTAHRRHLDFDDEYDLADTSAPQRSKWSGPFHFIQAADCQFGMIDSYVHKRTEPGWREEIELCEKLVDQCHRMHPKPLFMIICGDLVDSLPCSEIGRKQVVDFKRIFAKLDQSIPLVCVCGNHDVGDEPTTKTVNEYRQTFGEDYFYFTKNDILFIVINSQFYQHRDNVQLEAREQDEWLESLLAKCRLFKYSIIFEHIPWFLQEANEENDYFNIKKEVRLKWLRKFKDAGVTKIMCGHYHRNAGGWFEDMELVVTSAIGAQCGNDRSGIRIVRVFDKSIQHQYYAMQDVPLEIELPESD